MLQPDTIRWCIPNQTATSQWKWKYNIWLVHFNVTENIYKKNERTSERNGFKRRCIWHISLTCALSCQNFTFQHPQTCHRLNEWRKQAADIPVCLSGAASAQEHSTADSSPRPWGEVMSTLVADGWRAPPLWLPGAAKHKYGLLLWLLQDKLTAPRFILEMWWRRWMNVSLSRLQLMACFR